MALRCGRLTPYILKNVCIYWNKAVRRIVNVPYTTHTCMLGPILNQTHISTQLIKDAFGFYLEWLADILLLCIHVIKMLLAMLIRQWAQT